MSAFLYNADVTGDGNISIDDIVLLVKYIGLKKSGLPLSESDFPRGQFPGQGK